MQDTIFYMRDALTSALDSAHSAPLYDEREVRSIIDLLFEEVCGISRLDRVLHPDLHLTSAQQQVMYDCARKLSSGVPVQQVLGYEWFCGRKFRVTPDVLIPRPETAELIDWIRQTVELEMTGQNKTLQVLDMGTGSGCIAITLARLINHSEVLAIDLSTAALNISRQNAYEQGVDNVQFAECDILKCNDNNYFESVIHHNEIIYQQSSGMDYIQNMDGCEHSSLHIKQDFSQRYPQKKDTPTEVINTTFDLIVSNPPYICQKESAEMSPLVLNHEPSLALFVPDDDPLLFYRAIARFAHSRLTEGGHLFFEINAAYGQQTCLMLCQEGFSKVELRQDVNGRDRMVRASCS